MAGSRRLYEFYARIEFKESESLCRVTRSRDGACTDDRNAAVVCANTPSGKRLPIRARCLGREASAMTFPFFTGWRNAAAATSAISGSLRDLCPRFVSEFTRWVDTFPSSISSEREFSADLDCLEESWSSTLPKIEILESQNLLEAMVMFEAAQVYARWSSPGEGRASALIAAASLSLHKFLAQGAVATRKPVRDLSRDHRPKKHQPQLSRSVHPHYAGATSTTSSQPRHA